MLLLYKQSVIIGGFESQSDFTLTFPKAVPINPLLKRGDHGFFNYLKTFLKTDYIHVVEMIELVSRWTENTMGKGENAGYSFPKIFFKRLLFQSL